ncbi:hypothetical protein CerSpe_103760 [Prunus speciosa]
MLLQGIYEKGGRKFGVAGVVSLGCLPGTRAYNSENTDACVEQITKVVKLHSRQLAKALLKLKRQRHGFKYSNPNLYNYINERIENPSKFGFKEGKVACCGSGQYRGIDSCGGKRGVTEYELCDNVSEYVYFDSGHPTERVYQHVSKLKFRQKCGLISFFNQLRISSVLK